MAFNKKNWQDNVSDITAAELNRIEQGIYDNSLVVDAITNTLNPTDTETYKTAELTEGQITDVIGVNDIVIKGDTEQDGTPTPSAPVDVNVVSGSNVINTSNKNLFIPTLRYNNRDINQNNCIVTLNKDEFKFVASGADMYFGHIGSTGTIFVDTYGVLYKVLNNKTIRFTITNTTFNKNYIVKYDKDKKILGYQQFNSNSGTITFTDDVKYYSFRIGYGSATAGTTYKTKIQVELGSTATTYEPHQGKELPLDLLVGNLAYIEEKNKYRKYSTGAFQETPYFDSYIAKVIPNVTYATKSLSEAVDYSNLCYFDENMQYLSGEAFSTEVRTRTFTTPANCGYVTIAVPHTITQFMLVKGTVEDIKPIELCKIGNYHDYFYKSGSKWYLHKEIGKKIFNGSENFGEQTQTGFYRYTYANSSIKNDSSLANSLILFSNYFKFIPFNNRNNETNETVYAICNGVSGHNAIMFNTTTFTSLNDFKTWLASNNTKVYYLLENATDTKITGTLKEQLEAIYNAPLYEQTNITQTNNDLPMVLDITACKDNINGIKAFIRK